MAKLEKIVEELEGLTLPEVAELKKMLEERWGVTAAAPIMMGAMPVAGAAGGEAEAAEEKTEFDVVLEEVGAEKIKVIKAVREINPELGLREAKEVVEGAPSTVLQGAKKEDAEAATKSLEEAGAKVTIK